MKWPGDVTTRSVTTNPLAAASSGSHLETTITASRPLVLNPRLGPFLSFHTFKANSCASSTLIGADQLLCYTRRCRTTRRTPNELISLLVTNFADVRDEAYEGKYSRLQVTSNTMLRVLDSLARLSVYTVPSSKSSYTALLPHFLFPRSSLLHTLIIIVLIGRAPRHLLKNYKHGWLG